MPLSFTHPGFRALPRLALCLLLLFVAGNVQAEDTST